MTRVLRYCIAFIVRPNPGYRTKHVWPKVFKSEKEAGEFIKFVTRPNGASGLFLNRKATAQRGRIVSATVATIVARRK